MKYLLMIYANQQTWAGFGPDDWATAIPEQDAAAVHAEAASTESTDWAQILGLYTLLRQLAPNPVVTLNRAVALPMVRGPRAGLALLDALDDDQRLATGHRLLAVRAHLLEMAGQPAGARTAYLAAARRTTSQPEKRYLERHAAALAGAGPG